MGVILLALPLLLLSQAGDVESAPRQQSAAFGVERTTVWVGRTAVLSFRPGAAPVEELELPCATLHGGILEVLSPPIVEAGASSGSLRVRGLAPGTTTLTVGTAELVVDVRPLVAEARVWRLEPSISTPVLGAKCTGTVSVGVEVTRADRRVAFDVVLELPGGRRLQPVRPFVDDGGPSVRRRFDVDVETLDPGQHTLRAVVLRGEAEAGSAETTIDVVRAGGSTIAGECEDGLDAERPEAFRGRTPRAGGATDASGGAFVALPRNDTVWVAPIDVPSDGEYQLFVRARGDLAGGAFPSIGFSVDSPRPYSGSTRLVDHRWQRVPVGGPIELYEGEHHLALRLLNDLSVGTRSDRELFVDSWELVHLDREGPSDGEALMMMQAATGGQRGPQGPGLWVALERPFDGLKMTGRLWIRGAANWSGAAGAAAPQVDLVVDGEVRGTQQTGKPSFALDRAHLGAGDHEVYLRASLPDGRTARTPVQRLTVEGPVAEAIGRDVLRFDVLDQRWDDGFAATLDAGGEETRQRVVYPRSAVEARLRLPDDIEGTFELALEARAGGGDRPARATAIVERAGERGEELETRIQDWWNLRSFGRIDLAPGETSITLRLEPRDQDPQLRVRSLLLRRVRAEGDRRPPTARIVYPATGHVAFGVDAVVVDGFDDDAIVDLDAVIDGRPQGTFGRVPEGAGLLYAPLLLRDVAPGEHTLSVRVFDQAGNMAQTEPVTFTVLAAAPAEPGRHRRAVHLLNRLGFGPDPAELCEVLTRGEGAWLAAALEDESTGDEAARGFAATRAGDRLAYDADRHVVAYALRTDNPVRTRYTLWVDDHFSTWAGKTGAPSEWVEHREIARMGWAPFGEHLRASATSGVMLVYLDQDRSYAGRINENYARELLELHTVGVDAGYGQDDVTGLARLLAGLTVSQEAPADGSGAYQRRVFRFDPELSDGRACTLFERKFDRTAPAARFDRFTEALELLERRPETARFIARKICEHYVAMPAPEDLVDALTTTFIESGGDPRRMLEALVAHPAFWAAIDEPRLATPIDYGLRLGRVTGQTAVDWSLKEFLQNSAMGIFDRVSPDGYPDDDESWADTNGLMQRWRWVQSIPWAVRGLVPNRARRYAGGDPEAFRQRIIDHAAVRLMGRTLGYESNEAALTFFEEDEAQLWQQVDNVIELICRLPESNLK